MAKERPTVKPISSVDDLTVDPDNANLGTPRGREALARSLRENGAGRSILADVEGRILAGNKTLEQATALGMGIRVVDTQGDELIVVRRIDLDLTRDAGARTLAIADNRVGELDLDWDHEKLARLHAEGFDLSSFWTNDELATLLGTTPEGHPDEDVVLEPGATTIAPGDFFELGHHRLLCGDATSPDDVALLLDGITPVLMATDPPYGVNYDPAWRKQLNPSQRTAVGRVANDDRAGWAEAWHLFPGDVAYVWHACLKAPTVAANLEAAGFTVRSQIIWVKQHFALSRGDYHFGHEPAWYAVRKGATSHWQGDRTQSTVWSVPNLNAMGGSRTDDNAPTGHSTQKPVRLFEIPILNHTSAGGAIYDPFSGSGTAIIAAEKLGRACFAMDIDPKYIQVAVSRWETFTGKRARRIGRRRAGRRS